MDEVTQKEWENKQVKEKGAICRWVGRAGESRQDCWQEQSEWWNSELFVSPGREMITPLLAMPPASVIILHSGFFLYVILSGI